MSFLTVDSAGFGGFASAMRSAVPSLSVELTRNLQAGGVLVEAEYKARAATTQGQVAVTSGNSSASVVLSGPPIVSLEERSSGSWRHPVFGNTDVWVSQKSHPALKPALMAKAPEVYDLAIEAVQTVFDQVAAA